MVHQCWDVCRAGLKPHRTGWRSASEPSPSNVYKEELKRRINAVLAAPDTNDQEHRDQGPLRRTT